MVTLFIASIAASAEPDCEPADHDRFVELVDQGEASLKDLRWGLVDETSARLIEELPCIGFELRPAEVARVFRLRGWALSEDRDPEGHLWLAAGYGADRSFSYAPELRGPMGRQWLKAQQRWERVRFQQLPEPKTGAVKINGRYSRNIPTGLPWVLQSIDDASAVRQTWLVMPGAPVPADYEDDQAREPAPVLPVSNDARRWPVYAAVGGSVMGTGLVLVGVGSGVGAQDPLSDQAFRTSLGTNVAGISLLVAGGGIAALSFGRRRQSLTPGIAGAGTAIVGTSMLVGATVLEAVNVDAPGIQNATTALWGSGTALVTGGLTVAIVDVVRKRRGSR